MGKGALQNISHLVSIYGAPKTIIEIGVFEGGTTFWLSDNLSKTNKSSQIYAIDPHVGSNDMSEDFTVIKENFEYNLAVHPAKNVNYIQKHSKDGLLDLINMGVKAELIYIDGDHRAAEVLTDLVLSWELLTVGGIVLCDDTTTWKYKDTNGTESAQMSPRLAVETFIQCNWHKLNVLSIPDGAQTAFIKIQE